MDDRPAATYDIVALVTNDLRTDQRMRKTLGTLTDAGYRCFLLGVQRTDSQPLDQTGFAQERHLLSAPSGKRFYWQVNRAHERSVRELRPRLVLAADLDTLWGAYRASRALGVPLVFDAHELFEEQPEVARRPWIRLAWQTLGRWLVPRTDARYTVGEDIAEELARRYRKPFDVVRNYPLGGGVPAAQSLPKATDAPFTVLYQGALNEGRGLEELIEAAAGMPDLRVWLVGRGPLGDTLRAFAKTCGASNVEFLGERTPEELRELTPTADLGYALMRNVGQSYYLSLSNKSIDYLRAGLPSLQMDWPEYRRIDNAYGCYHLVADLSVASVREAIGQCREAGYYNRLARAAAEAGAVLTWQSQEPTLRAVFDKLLPSD